MIKPKVYIVSYYGHNIEITLTSVAPEREITEIPDPVQDWVINAICEDYRSGEFTPDECKQIVEGNMYTHYAGTWRILELNFGVMENVILWINNHYPDESLTEELFVKYFGICDGKHFYGKWEKTFNKNFLDMINYFRNSGNKGQLFCNMVLEQINKYKIRENKV